MERITERQIRHKFRLLANLLNLPISADLVRKEGNCWSNDFMALDKNFIYGGYVLMLVHKETGGESYLGRNTRQNSREFDGYLQGWIDALTTKVELKDGKIEINKI